MSSVDQFSHCLSLRSSGRILAVVLEQRLESLYRRQGWKQVATLLPKLRYGNTSLTSRVTSLAVVIGGTDAAGASRVKSVYWILTAESCVRS